MAWAALIAWVTTALGGGGLLLQWLRHGGLSQREGIRAPRLFTHAGLAALGLALWIGHNRREHTVVPAETSFPLPLVVLHGVLGLVTLVLALLAASGIGT